MYGRPYQHWLHIVFRHLQIGVNAGLSLHRYLKQWYHRHEKAAGKRKNAGNRSSLGGNSAFVVAAADDDSVDYAKESNPPRVMLLQVTMMVKTFPFCDCCTAGILILHNNKRGGKTMNEHVFCPFFQNFSTILLKMIGDGKSVRTLDERKLKRWIEI